MESGVKLIFVIHIWISILIIIFPIPDTKKYSLVLCYVVDSNNVNLYQGKWWWAAMMASAAYQTWSCSLALPPTPAPSLICLKQGITTASPSFLGGGWSSVGEEIVVTTLTPASPGLQAVPAGLSSTL